MTEEKYPEHEKLRAVMDKTQVMGEFFDWLQCEHEVFLASYEYGRDCYPGRSPRKPMAYVAEFFDIDERKLEEEKLAMVDSMRALNE